MLPRVRRRWGTAAWVSRKAARVLMFITCRSRGRVVETVEGVMVEEMVEKVEVVELMQMKEMMKVVEMVGKMNLIIVVDAEGLYGPGHEDPGGVDQHVQTPQGGHGAPDGLGGGVLQGEVQGEGGHLGAAGLPAGGRHLLQGRGGAAHQAQPGGRGLEGGQGGGVWMVGRVVVWKVGRVWTGLVGFSHTCSQGWRGGLPPPPRSRSCPPSPAQPCPPCCSFSLATGCWLLAPSYEALPVYKCAAAAD